MASVKLTNITKKYPNGIVAVKDFNIDIEDKEFIIFVGPSGCGKSTTLRMVAGLEEITSGQLEIDGVVMNNVQPKDRDIAMVFQNYALYPHLSVFDNMAFGLKLRKVPKDIIEKQVKDAAKMLDLEPLLNRKPRALSGGQRQRVAMGRALVRHPKVFLMDEPLSNLDAKLRVQMRTEIGKLHQRLGATMIYVTHDQVEAMTLGTRIVVMKDGIVQQIATPDDLYNKPYNAFVAGFIGSPQMNFIETTFVEENSHFYLQINSAIRIPLSVDKADVLINEGYLNKRIIMGIRPEHINDIDDSATAPGVIIDAEVSMYEMLGAEAYLYFELAGISMIARIIPKKHIKSGDNIKLAIDSNRIHIFDKDSGLNIVKM